MEEVYIKYSDNRRFVKYLLELRQTRIDLIRSIIKLFANLLYNKVIRSYINIFISNISLTMFND